MLHQMELIRRHGTTTRQGQQYVLTAKSATHIPETAITIRNGNPVSP